jgi:hypothetical protein
MTMNERSDNLSRLHRRSTTARGCPSAEALGALAAGRAWPWQRRRLAAHLGGCRECADDYRALLVARPGLQAALDEAGAVHGPSGPAIRTGGALAAAAVGAAALGIALLADAPAPQPAPEPGVLFASQFEPRSGAERSAGGDDRLFGSDFGDEAARRDG